MRRSLSLYMFIRESVVFLSLLSENNLYLRGKTHTYRISLMLTTYEQFFYMTLFLVILMDWRLPVEVAIIRYISLCSERWDVYDCPPFRRSPFAEAHRITNRYVISRLLCSSGTTPVRGRNSWRWNLWYTLFRSDGLWCHQGRPVVLFGWWRKEILKTRFLSLRLKPGCRHRFRENLSCGRRKTNGVQVFIRIFAEEIEGMFGIIVLCSQCPFVRQMFIVIRLADKHVTVAIKWHGTYPPQKRAVVGFVQEACEPWHSVFLKYRPFAGSLI